MTRGAAAFALLVLFCASACSGAPPVRSDGPHGRVLAWSHGDARVAQELGGELGARVAELLGVEPQPYVLWFEREVASGAGVRVWRDRAGRIVDRRIELGADAREVLPYALAHELVHWHMGGTLWDALPQTLEEGLADHLGVLLVPEARAEREAWLREHVRAAHAFDWDALFALTERDWAQTPRATKDATYVLGRFLVERIGLAELRALCERAVAADLARVPQPWVLAAAGLDCGAAERTAALVRWGGDGARERELVAEPSHAAARPAAPHERLDGRIEHAAPR